MYNPEIIICDDYEALSQVCAGIIARRVAANPTGAFGFATGGTPVGAYKALIALYEAGKVDFSRITAYNLDEYYPIQKSSDQSYDWFMRETLFRHVGICREQTHIPNGEAPDPEIECAAYVKQIEQTGGIDFQILGIGNNGHIGFNEPDDVFSGGGLYVTLAEETIHANARFFTNEADIPRHAITMGISTIMKAKEILLMATGKGKARIIKETLRGPITPRVPASILQARRDVTFVLDRDAASEL